MGRKVVCVLLLALILVGTLPAIAKVGVDNDKSQILNEDDSASLFSTGDSLSFSSLIERTRSAYVKNDLIEVVIGLSKTQPRSYDRISNLALMSGCEVADTISMGGETVALVVNTPVKTVSSFVESVSKTDLARYVEPNTRFDIQFTPNDPDWNLQWGPQKIQADYAWNITVGSPSVLVAVIDTGIDYTHPELAGNYVALGYDWVNNDNDPMDDHGHGTHCAGIIAAALNNGIGIAGVAQVRIMAEKGLNAGGSGSASNLAKAITHAVDVGADILSNSWGSAYYNSLIHDAMKYAKDHGVLVLAAAGNDGTAMKHYPAAYEEVVAVTATNKSDTPATFTSYGRWVEVAAPGVSIYSTYLGGTYKTFSGTSMACPHAAAVAALIWSRFPGFTLDEVRLRLLLTADDLGDAGFDNYYGYGRVNAKRAVEPLPAHDLLIMSWYRPSYVEPGSTGTVTTTVTNVGSNNEAGVTVQLRANGSVVNSTYISYLESMKSTTVSCSWTPTVEGKYYVQSYIVPVSGETIVDNNVRSAYVNVRVGDFIMVPEDCLTIGEAVALADVGETVRVASGIYYEHVCIATPLKLVGENRDTTFIDGGGAATVVDIIADNVEISGFTVQNSGKTGLPESGIALSSVQDCVVANNTVTNDFEGVLLWECFGNNSVYNNIAFSIKDGCVGSVWGAGNDTIKDNTILGGQFGVALVRGMFDDPSCEDRNNTVSSNTITNSEYGIAAISDNNTIVNNNISLCSTNGIWLAFSNHTITGNRLMFNEIGIYMEGTVSFGKIYHNDFVYNKMQIQYYSGGMPPNAWDDGYPSGGNFWSNYSGVDVKSGPGQDLPGSDGLGDTPHSICADNIDRFPLMNPHGGPIPQVYSLEITAESHGTTNPPPRNYTYMADSAAHVTAIPDARYSLDHWTLDGVDNGSANPCSILMDDNHTLHAIFAPVHDVAAKDVESKAVVGQGYNLTIKVTVENEGAFTETFNVTVQISTIFKNQTVTLASGESITVTFRWNTTVFAKGIYTMSASASQVVNETDLDDNTFIYGSVTVTIPGDVDADFDVDIYDIVGIASCYGAKKGEWQYAPVCDINDNEVIDIYDVVIACTHYGQRWS